MLVCCCISPILLATKLFHFLELDLSHANTMVESDHKCRMSNFIGIALFTLLTNCDNKTAPHSSNRGSEVHFKGATLDREQTNLEMCLFCLLLLEYKRKLGMLACLRHRSHESVSLSRDGNLELNEEPSEHLILAVLSRIVAILCIY